ncbi:hypothetical protein DSCW_15400 [Desulfosarcina widdelii]|uniref:DUF4124 domain-containing protein n=1 Tax=Desulfosarcina widdelii TaxID=947919 RepID=A0A5K7Z201_9BACT|nr:hypothetical protein [Desulfosarcina widdelii]BBO74123.1 hypothetical protein DSCW_15400 [Desulfosarcina widdelii]
MKKTILAIFSILLGLLFAAYSNAEIYKYLDENGQKRWTDDLSQVPVEQRDSADRMDTEATFETPSDRASDEAAPSEPAEKMEEATSDTDEPNRGALEKEKADLDTMYQELLQERQQIEKAKAEAKGAQAKGALGKRISAYNEKAEKYEERLKAFNKNVNEYNQRIQSATKNE